MIKRHAATITHSFSVNAVGARWKTVGKSSAPVSRWIRIAASTRPTSPITLITNALMPA
jgi:hypothetical protein